MEIKLARKYKNSSLFGILIDRFEVYENGLVTIYNKVGSKKTFYLSGCESIEYFDADYFLCEIQYDVDIDVRKY